jgi:hypothetical protein
MFRQVHRDRRRAGQNSAFRQARPTIDCKGGERFSPSQVKRRGIAAPSAKALETSFMDLSITLQETSARV